MQQEFEDDRTDYLDTIRKQDQQLILLQQILDKVQPTMRKDSNYSNIEKIKQEASFGEHEQLYQLLCSGSRIDIAMSLAREACESLRVITLVHGGITKVFIRQQNIGMNISITRF